VCQQEWSKACNQSSRTLQEIQGILALVKEKTGLTGLNCHAQEVVKLTQILHGKLLLK
jgi:hypothetical protein